MRYIQSRHKDWKFDFNSFIQKEFPPDPKVRVEAAVPEEVMEEQKKCFNVSLSLNILFITAFLENHLRIGNPN